MHRQTLLMAGIVALLSVFAASELLAQSDSIEKRQKLMKSNSAANKALKAAVAKNDYATVELKAKELAKNGEMLGDLFPKGSTSEESRAKPAIWEKWDDFSSHVTAFKDAASALATAAASKNEMEVGAKFKALGSTCGGCHKPYRAEKKK